MTTTGPRPVAARPIPRGVGAFNVVVPLLATGLMVGGLQWWISDAERRGIETVDWGFSVIATFPLVALFVVHVLVAGVLFRFPTGQRWMWGLGNGAAAAYLLGLSVLVAIPGGGEGNRFLILAGFVPAALLAAGAVAMLVRSSPHPAA